MHLTACRLTLRKYSIRFSGNTLRIGLPASKYKKIPKPLVYLNDIINHFLSEIRNFLLCLLLLFYILRRMSVLSSRLFVLAPVYHCSLVLLHCAASWINKQAINKRTNKHHRIVIVFFCFCAVVWLLFLSIYLFLCIIINVCRDTVCWVVSRVKALLLETTFCLLRHFLFYKLSRLETINWCQVFVVTGGPGPQPQQPQQPPSSSLLQQRTTPVRRVQSYSKHIMFSCCVFWLCNPLCGLIAFILAGNNSPEYEYEIDVSK